MGKYRIVCVSDFDFDGENLEDVPEDKRTTIGYEGTREGLLKTLRGMALRYQIKFDLVSRLGKYSDKSGKAKALWKLLPMNETFLVIEVSEVLSFTCGDIDPDNTVDDEAAQKATELWEKALLEVAKSPTPEELEAAKKEARRKQFEKLKAEFGSEEK